MFKNACDIHINEGKVNNIAGDVDMHVRFASPTTTTDWKLGLLLILFSVFHPGYDVMLDACMKLRLCWSYTNLLFLTSFILCRTRQLLYSIA